NVLNLILTSASSTNTMFRASYGSYSRPTTMVDAANKSSFYTYDGSGSLITAVLPEGETWTYQYDAKGLNTLIVDGVGKSRAFEYDGMGYKTKSIIDAGGAAFSTTYVVDALGRVLTTTTPEGFAT